MTGVATAAARWGLVVLTVVLAAGCANRPLPVVGESPAVVDGSADARPTSAPQPSPASDGVMSWSQVQAMALPEPGVDYAYGAAASQFGTLRLPAGDGPFPVAVVLHGGCWLEAFDVDYITHLSAALTAAGVATWTPEYRRVGEAGGGWPGTFDDVATATDYLGRLALVHPLDLQHVVAVGHSAGGHLALWLAMRDQRNAKKSGAALPTHDVAIKGVVGLAAIADLAAYRIGPPNSCHAAVDALMGGGPEAVPERYRAASPAVNLPLGVPQVLVQGSADPIVSVASVRTYADSARLAGDAVDLHVVDAAGHFEPALPQAAAWPVVRDAVLTLLRVD